MSHFCDLAELASLLCDPAGLTLPQRLPDFVLLSVLLGDPQSSVTVPWFPLDGWGRKGAQPHLK